MFSHEFVPGVGLGPIRFGDTREQVRAAVAAELGAPVIDGNQDLFADRGLQVLYNDAGGVEFVEVFVDWEVELFFRGANLVHDIDADILAKVGSPDESDDDWPADWTYPDLGLLLSRDVAPEDLRADRIDAGDEAEEDPFWDEEIEQAQRFTSIGMSLPGHLGLDDCVTRPGAG